MRDYTAALLERRSSGLDSLTSADLEVANAPFEQYMAKTAAQASMPSDTSATSSASLIRPSRRPETPPRQEEATGNPYVPAAGCNPYVTVAEAADGGGSLLGKDLLPDRARTLKACAKSEPSKSKRKQFEEKWGYKKARGGKCRDYFADVYSRDPW